MFGIDALVGMIFGATLVWGSRPVWRFWRPSAKVTFKDAKEVALVALEASLIEHPEDWRQENHYLFNTRSEIRIWIANEDYALHLKGRNWELNEDLISAEWRKRLWKATLKEERAFRSLVDDLTKAYSTPLQIEDAKEGCGKGYA